MGAVALGFLDLGKNEGEDGVAVAAKNTEGNGVDFPTDGEKGVQSLTQSAQS